VFPPLLVVILLVLVIVPVWQSWRARVQLRARIRAEWGHPRMITRDMEAVGDFFRSVPPGDGFIDDRTWADLLMDSVFAQLDRTESSVGQQILYYRLRSASAPRNLHAFDALITAVSGDPSRRERAQVALSRLRAPSVYYLHRLARQGGVDELPRWYAVFPVWTGAALITMVLAFFWPKLIGAAVLCFIVNFAIRQLTARRLVSEIAWFRAVGPFLSVSSELATLGGKETEEITGSLTSDLARLKRLGAAMRWLSRDPTAVDPIAFALLEFLNVVFLLDTNALYFGVGELLTQGPVLLKVIEIVGDIDAAIAVASFRKGSDGWIRPRFVQPEAPVMFANICHPLVDHAVPNSIGLAPPHGVLITGSNMSGKSTFLRTVGSNVVLAQSINTCLAGNYEAPIYSVRSCIGRADDLVAGKSYYLVEVESVLALVKASTRATPHLFIFDELFRGTNAVERIAAAEAVLRELISKDKPHIVLAATHDGELVDLLRDNYSVYHFSDSVGPDGLVFDYRLQPGPATTRNAIALLRLSGASESLVSRALDLATALDQRKQL
jgi:hypothetical protein